MAVDEIGALTVSMITEALDRRGDDYTVDPAGTVLGRWDDAVIQFRRAGAHQDILHARVVAGRRLAATRARRRTPSATPGTGTGCCPRRTRTIRATVSWCWPAR